MLTEPDIKQDALIKKEDIRASQETKQTDTSKEKETEPDQPKTKNKATFKTKVEDKPT